MPRKKATRARGLTYAQKIARLRAVYTPSFRARKRFTPQQKSAITRQWKKLRQRATYYYKKGFRVPPKEPKQRIPKWAPGPPKRKPRLPKIPPRITTKKKKDTTYANMEGQPLWRIRDYCKRMVRNNRLIRVLFKIREKDKGKSPTFTKDTTIGSSGWYWLGGYTDEQIDDFLGRWGEIVAIASVPRRPA